MDHYESSSSQPPPPLNPRRASAGPPRPEDHHLHEQQQQQQQLHHHEDFNSNSQTTSFVNLRSPSYPGLLSNLRSHSTNNLQHSRAGSEVPSNDSNLLPRRSLTTNLGGHFTTTDSFSNFSNTASRPPLLSSLSSDNSNGTWNTNGTSDWSSTESRNDPVSRCSFVSLCLCNEFGLTPSFPSVLAKEDSSSSCFSTPEIDFRHFWRRAFQFDSSGRFTSFQWQLPSTEPFLASSSCTTSA